MIELKGKNIIVTGGTRGIGFGIVKELVTLGANVVTCGRSDAPSDKLKELMNENEGKIVYIRADISDVSYCKLILDTAINKFGKLDGLVNNTAIFPRHNYFTITGEQFDEVFNVNAKGTFFLTKYAVEFALEKESALAIVQIGSENAFAGEPDLAVYSCSKGAVRTLNKHIALNYGRNKIRSNWVTVGWVATETELSRFESIEIAKEELAKAAKKYIPLGRLQTNEDVAQTVSFLLSDSSSQITGTEIHVTGGKFF